MTNKLGLDTFGWKIFKKDGINAYSLETSKYHAVLVRVHTLFWRCNLTSYQGKSREELNVTIEGSSKKLVQEVAESVIGGWK